MKSHTRCHSLPSPCLFLALPATLTSSPFQYERGGTVVALQKRDTAQKQTIKALENRLQHLTQKMADAEQASLTVQRQQLERINALTEQLEEAQRKVRC
ncbi:hypothetical protein E2C01_097331 [Portunus trituberculatus]|uniref:Uncharacterized protein n=1 Tax=Portunus trituberculatus TaxID=210409 RepID=A0A5B7K4C6_PORTR|nr:hypothetical protein [Portunus trituberculatus]